MRDMRIVCECCGRQIVPGQGIPDEYTTYGPVKRLCFDTYVCGPCGKDLDENGLFPEERTSRLEAGFEVEGKKRR